MLSTNVKKQFNQLFLSNIQSRPWKTSNEKNISSAKFLTKSILKLQVNLDNVKSYIYLGNIYKVYKMNK